MKKTIIASAILAVLATGAATTASAALANNTQLNFDAGVTTTSSYGTQFVKAGSYFGMDTNGSGDIKASERVAISQNNGLIVGTVQDASGSHSGAVDGTESPDIDAAWEFFGNTGLSYSIAATNVLTDDGAGGVILDFSGWGVTWNGITRIDMSAGAWEGNLDGQAIVTCAVDCAESDTYTLQYSATVPLNDASGFGGVMYNFYLTGTVGAAVSAVPVPAAVWLFGSGLIGLAGVARRRKSA